MVVKATTISATAQIDQRLIITRSTKTPHARGGGGLVFYDAMPLAMDDGDKN